MRLFHAVQRAVRELQGAYAIAVVSSREPNTVVGSRKGSPLLLGVGNAGTGHGENFLASDTSALLQVTKYVTYLEEGDVVEIRLDGYSIVDRDGQPAERPIIESQLSADSIELGSYAHYMQKEIFEQPGAIANTLEMVTSASSLSPGLFGADAEEVFARTKQLLILACGTSYHAGLVAKYWIESVAKIPVAVEIASEYRYRESVPLPGTLVMTISQSGETIDTISALQHAQAQGLADSLTICNVPESALIRQSKLRFLTRAGPEIGVASTKAFTTQLASLFVLTLVLAKQRGLLAPEREAELLTQLRHLPAAMNHVLECELAVRHWANRFAPKEHALFLGRGVHFPIAMEGALKLKEITYIHAEAYAAGELKHGPLALVDSQMPVVVVAPNDALIEKLKSNLQEVRARGGELFIFADRDVEIEPADGINIVNLVDHAGLLSPILHVVPLQLLAYHAALARGTDVDKPRNLAKSVTVE
jgi:glucosamine--fructose-6-phosphate aminotransferase (isomerizing)